MALLEMVNGMKDLHLGSKSDKQSYLVRSKQHKKDKTVQSS